MRILSFVLLMLVGVAAGAQETRLATKPKLSPLTRHYLKEVEGSQGRKLPGYIYNKRPDGRVYISALIKVSDAAIAAEGLQGLGAFVGTKAGAIWTVKVPMENVVPMTNLDGISYIQLDEPLKPTLNVARKTTRVDSAQGGYNLPKGFSGEGVVVGVIDFGFDYNHPTFYDTTYAGYRIKSVWEMNSTGTPPTGYSYGKEITDTNLIKAEATDNAAQTHGSSTTGMAAGSGYGSTNNSKLRGMAYAADIVLVGVRRDSIGGEWLEGSFSDFLDGVAYIFNYAKSVGKPAVVNISWGSQSGSHDGTSLFNQACDALTGPGKIVVMSAGNEGAEKLHLSKTFTPTNNEIKTYLTFTPATYQRTWVDIWGQPTKTFCAKATLYHNGIAGQTTDFHCIDDQVTDTFLIADNGLDTCFVEFITSSKEATNNKPRITVNIFDKATDSVGISVQGTDGSIDMWDEYYYYGFPHSFQSAFDSMLDPTAVSGNTITTVSDMGSAKSVLLIGAYASKTSYADLTGTTWSYGGFLPNRLVSFSSRGPMIDGRIKPDITAPGLTIATATNSMNPDYTDVGAESKMLVAKYTDPTSHHDFYYSEFSGTSASGPAASGIVALMLEANPNLGPDDVKNYIFSTAIVDVFTGALPTAGNNDWGHGKINAYGALKAIVHDMTVGVPVVDPNKISCRLFPNPNNGTFSIDYTGKEAQRLSVFVYNEAGTLICMKPWQVDKGYNHSTLSLPEVARGVYVVKVVASLGGTTVINTVIK